VPAGREADTLAAAPELAVISATVSVAMGRGAALLDAWQPDSGSLALGTGGPTPLFVAPSADLELAVRGLVFAAPGTCGSAAYRTATGSRTRALPQARGNGCCPSMQRADWRPTL